MVAEFLSEDDRNLLDAFKEEGLITITSLDGLLGITKNGGVATFCGDGDIDAYKRHCEEVTIRAHSIKVFGGPLIFASSFNGYNKQMASGLIENIRMGMKVKQTTKCFLYFHFPCGMAREFNHSLENIINYLAPEAINAFKDLTAPEKIYSFLHVKEYIDDSYKQSIYHLNVNI
jgi:hypothetical protein